MRDYPIHFFWLTKPQEKSRYLEVALKSMKFLTNTQTINNIFVPIGNRGWYKRDLNEQSTTNNPSKPPAQPKQQSPLLETQAKKAISMQLTKPLNGSWAGI